MFILSDCQALVISEDPYQTQQNAASDEGLHCYSLVLHFSDTSTGSLMDV